MLHGGERGNVAQFMTPEETAELNRVREDSSVVGYALISFEGAEVESHGAFKELSAAVFANVVDLVDKMGEEIGESDTCPMMFIESPDFEVAVLTMSSAKAVIIKRRQRPQLRGLSSVS